MRQPRGMQSAVWPLLLVLLVRLPDTLLGQVDVVITRRPSLASSQANASFAFEILDGEGRDACAALRCFVRCKLDRFAFQDCSSGRVSYMNLQEMRHAFEVSVSTSTGLRASSGYSWILDTVAPTAYIVPSHTFTAGFNVTARIVFSEPCFVPHGFHLSCAKQGSCPVTVRGPGVVVPSSLTAIRDNAEYSLTVSLSNSTSWGRVVLVVTRGFCADTSGNTLERSNNSVVIVRFDRRSVMVNVWTPIVNSLLLTNNVARTVEATNRVEDLKIFLDFTEPIVNTTRDLSSLLRSNFGLFEATRRKSRGNRRFAFLLRNTSTTGAVITVELDASHVISRAGSNVQPVAPVSFIFDQVRPRVLVSTLWRAKTKDRLLPFLIQFSEPVFHFTSTTLIAEGGRISRFREVSKSIYYVEVTVVREDNVVLVSVPENAAADIAGNTNVASNVLRVRHYTVPPISGVLYSLVSAALIVTAVFSGALSISCANLAAAGALSSTTVSAIVTDPSRNLLGLAAHLQIFALSERLTVPSVPTGYLESVRGLQWLIPRMKVPWEPDRPPFHAFDLDSLAAPASIQTRLWSHRRKLGANSSVFGPPLGAAEYKRYFQTPSRIWSTQDLLRRQYTGWADFEKNMFWLAVAGIVLVLVHLTVLTFLRWRTKTSMRGALSVPRFELFLALLSLPCITQACAFLISGSTVGGIVVGVVLLALPAVLILGITAFLAVGVGNAAFVQYQQVDLVTDKQAWLLSAMVGRQTYGRWVRRAGVPSTLLPRYGLLFEDRKGPPKVVIVDPERDVSAWVDSGSNGIGRMKAINWEGEQVQQVALWSRTWFVGAARTAYILVDILRRVALGFLFGAYQPMTSGVSQALAALLVTALQLLYLVMLKPSIRRGVQAVESVSLVCEAGLFATALALWYLQDRKPAQNDEGEESWGSAVAMLAFLLVTFTVQLVNEWYALVGLLLHLPPAGEASLRLGLKMFLRGILLPFVPQSRWSKFVTPHAQRQPRTGLVPVVQFSPSPDFQTPRPGVTETGMSYDPGSPSLADPRQHQGTSSSTTKKQTWNDWVRRSLSLSSGAPGGQENKSPDQDTLRVLMELAKASFSGGAAAAEEGEEEEQQREGKQKTGDGTTSSSSGGSAIVMYGSPSTQLRKAASWALEDR